MTSLNKHHIDFSFSLHLKGKKIYTDKIQSKLLYETLSSQISSEPTAMKKYNEMFNTGTFQIDWERVYSLPFQITLDTELREFQYKILHRMCYTNVMLFKFGLSESPLCYFCNEELETLEHFCFHCEKVNTFWNELNTILKSQDPVSTNFDIKDVLFGHIYFCSDNDDSILVNYI